jgi:hypothetical protein
MPGYWCHTHMAPRAQCANADGDCPEALRLAAAPSGPPRIGFIGLRRLTVEAAKRDGRELARASDFAHTQHWKKH